MNSKKEKIIEMLNEGKSYSQIQLELKVSPSKISLVKQAYADQLYQKVINGTESSTDFESSSSDALAQLELRNLLLEHQQKLKTLEYEEREKERQFVMEKLDKEIRKEQLIRDRVETITQARPPDDKIILDEECVDFEEAYNDAGNSSQPNDSMEKDTDPNFNKDFKDFAQMLCDIEGQVFNQQSVKFFLDKNDDLKFRLREILDKEGENNDKKFDQILLNECSNHILSLLAYISAAGPNNPLHLFIPSPTKAKLNKVIRNNKMLV
jgi:hypothetical protein